MFKYYSENGMIEIFGRPTFSHQRGMPPFLADQVPVRDLTPNDTDTDFHTFLKLTATTLAAQPTLSDELLSLRRSSIYGKPRSCSSCFPTEVAIWPSLAPLSSTKTKT